MNNADLPAMPVFPDTEAGHGSAFIGLTKREYFAGLAMQGLLAGGYCIDDARNRLNDVPSEAIHLANALLDDLEKKS